MNFIRNLKIFMFNITKRLVCNHEWIYVTFRRIEDISWMSNKEIEKYGGDRITEIQFVCTKCLKVKIIKFNGFLTENEIVKVASKISQQYRPQYHPKECK